MCLLHFDKDKKRERKMKCTKRYTFKRKYSFEYSDSDQMCLTDQYYLYYTISQIIFRKITHKLVTLSLKVQ